MGALVQCSRCKARKPPTAFNAYKLKDNGLSSWCRDCCNWKNREWSKRQKAWIHQYKTDHGCKDCGYREHYAALQFDHLGGKAFTIGESMHRYGRQRLLAEIEKCDVVCANCHMIRTWTRAHTE